MIWYIDRQHGQVALLNGLRIGVAENPPQLVLAKGSETALSYHYPRQRWLIDVHAVPPRHVVAIYRITHRVWEYGWATSTITVTYPWPRKRPIAAVDLLHAPRIATEMAQAWLDKNDIVFPFEPQRIAELPNIHDGDIASADGQRWTITIRAQPHAFCDCDYCQQAAPRHEILRWFRHKFRSWTRFKIAEVTQ